MAMQPDNYAEQILLPATRLLISAQPYYGYG